MEEGGRRRKRLRYSRLEEDWGDHVEPDSSGGDQGACIMTPKNPPLPQGRRGHKRKVAPNSLTTSTIPDYYKLQRLTMKKEGAPSGRPPGRTRSTIC